MKVIDVTREVYFQDDIVKIVIEDINNNPYIHVDIYKFNKSIYYYLQALKDQLEIDLWLSGYEYMFMYNPNEKFMNFLYKGTELNKKESDDGLVKLFYKKLKGV